MFGSAVFTSFNYLGLPRPGTERRSSESFRWTPYQLNYRDFEKKIKQKCKTRKKRKKSLYVNTRFWRVWTYISPNLIMLIPPSSCMHAPPPLWPVSGSALFPKFLYNWTLHRIDIYQDLDWTISNEERAWDTADTSWTTKWSVYQRQKTTNHAYAHM